MKSPIEYILLDKTYHLEEHLLYGKRVKLIPVRKIYNMLQSL